jgi:hypothetical protein
MALIVSISGCHADPSKVPLDLLERAEKFELLSLSPADDPNRPKAAERFHGWDVLGKKTITNPDLCNRLAAALRTGVNHSDTSGKPGCFNPRHGINFVHQGDSIDLVICFECGLVIVYTNATDASGFKITDSPQSTFNDALREVGLKVAP